jgi:arabinofuranosyltransferase
MKTQRIILAFSFLVFLILTYIFFPESIDDAYITLRFSKNLILGNGPVFNVGERVEGYSNFSWMVLLAAFGWAGAAMEMAMKYLSLISGLCVLALTWKLSSNYFKSNLAIVTPLILLGTSAFFAVWAVDGLETMFYTMLLTLLVYLLTSEKNNALWIGIIAGLIALTRPEGIMFSLIAVSYLTFRKGYLSGLKALALVALFAGGYEIFRYYYFGQLVSNTALAKVHMGADTIVDGLRYLLTYNEGSGYLLLPAALIGAFAAKKNSQLLIPISFVLAQIFFLMVSGGDFMHAYRFIIPVMPCIVLLCASSVEILYAKMYRKIALLTLVLIVTSQTYFQYASLPEKHISWDNLTYRSSTLFTIANFLSQHSDRNDWILLSEAGIIPYYVDAKIMDYIGLVTSYNAVTNFNTAFNSNYLYAVHPKFILISSVETNDGKIYTRNNLEATLLSNPNFSQYRFVRNFTVSMDGSFLDAIYYKNLSPDIKRVFFTVFERKN